MIDGLPLLAWPIHRPALTILMYHRVLPEPDPMRPDEVFAAAFERQMAFLRRHLCVLPLADAVDRLSRHNLPLRSCCITFDDGYADNLTIALPILESHGLTATVFVATGYLDGGRMFNDAVIDGIARATEPSLDLAAVGLGTHSLQSPEDRVTAIGAILNQLKYRRPEQRQDDVAVLLDTIGCGPLPGDIMLTSAQVAELARRGIDIGGHTVAHSILTSMNDEEALAEIVRGKQRLEELTGRPVRTFAYPNGRPRRDYAAQHVAMVRDAGFDLAVTTAHGVCTPQSDVFQLPRFTPWGKSMTMWGVRMMRNAWLGKAAATC
jgi:peptidoglycan/xylan/chitin deacetylase (PgdA/CDA1 family)